MNNKNWVQSVNQPNKKKQSKRNQCPSKCSMLLRFHWMPTGNRCTLHRPMSSIFQDVLYLVLLLHFFACIYVLDWIELIVLFAVWNEWNITAIRLIRFSYFALDFSTGCRFQLQCPYNSFVKNRRRFWLLLLFCIKDVRKRARTRLIRLSNWPHL